jgi:hypothetical protein
MLNKRLMPKHKPSKTSRKNFRPKMIPLSSRLKTLRRKIKLSKKSKDKYKSTSRNSTSLLLPRLSSKIWKKPYIPKTRPLSNNKA